MSGQTYYKERLGFDPRDEYNSHHDGGEKYGYEESLSKFKGWSWDLWTFFINIVGTEKRYQGLVTQSVVWIPFGLE